MYGSINLVDIKTINNSDLLRLVEKMNKTNLPFALKQENKTVALLLPATAEEASENHQLKTDYKAFLSCAGSLKGINSEQFKKDMYESRAISTRPMVTL